MKRYSKIFTILERSSHLASLKYITRESTHQAALHVHYLASINILLTMLIAYNAVTPANKFSVFIWISTNTLFHLYIIYRQFTTPVKAQTNRKLSAVGKRRFVFLSSLSIVPWVFAIVFVFPGAPLVGQMILIMATIVAFTSAGIHLARAPFFALLYGATATFCLTVAVSLNMGQLALTLVPTIILSISFLLRIIFNHSKLAIQHDQIVAELGENMAELQAAQEEIAELATKDPVTGLPNRRFFTDIAHERIEIASRENSEFRLILIDMDNFKALNDTHGHQHGDDFLLEVSQRLSDSADKQSFVARIGGDEFAILDWSIRDPESCKEFHESIITRLSMPVLLPNCEWRSSCSLGISGYPANAKDLSKLFSFADMALYRAKDSGRGVAVEFDPVLQSLEEQNDRIANQISEGIVEGEFELHYQPQLDIDNCQVIGLEALLRWNHNGTLKAPAEFVPVAEARGKTAELCDFVMEQAVIDAMWFQHQFSDIHRVSINIHTLQLRQPEKFLTQVGAFTKLGISPSNICFEVAAASLTGPGSENAVNILKKIQRMGFQISLENFGSGITSLSLLRDFNVDEIKIDRELIHGIIEDETSQTIARSIILLAKGLSVRIVVEGVEETQHVAYLQELGCHYYQGPLYSKPVPRSNVVDTLHTVRASALLPYQPRKSA